MQQMAICAKTGFGGEGGAEILETEKNKPILTLPTSTGVCASELWEGAT